jgi:thioesterase domain-containing protein/aryl carrier-like protein
MFVLVLRRKSPRRTPAFCFPMYFGALKRRPKLNPHSSVAAPNSTSQLQENTSQLPGLELAEKRLTEIWIETLQHNHIGLDDNFFDLGGDSVAAAALLQRISKEFGQDILLAQIFDSPTIRQQVQLIRQIPKTYDHLPTGVMAPQPTGTRRGIFWVHYLSMNLAKVIGTDQPLLYVAITAEDFPKLGRNPTLQVIATCLVQKILATQSTGPSAIGGYCLGGILAYEIASQLRSIGHEVSLLVLVDPPNPSYIESLDSFHRLASYLRYALKRSARLGVRTSLDYMLEHLSKYLTRVLKPKFAKSENTLTQELIEAAALKYQPQKYQGKALLVLASERPPHSNILPGWQAVVSDLHTEVLNGHHRDLFEANNARRVADAIVAQLSCATETRPAARVVSSASPNSGEMLPSLVPIEITK